MQGTTQCMGHPQYLRPMTMGETLDASFKLYRKHFRLLVTAQSPMVVMYLVLMVTSMYSLKEVTTFSTFVPLVVFLGSLLNSPSHYFLILALIHLLFIRPVTLAAVIKVASDSIVGTPSVRKAYLFSVKTWWKLGPTYLVFNIVLGILSFILLLLLGVISIPIIAFFWTRWILTFPVAVNDRTFLIKAMDRSWNLIKGRTFNVFGAMSLVSLIPFFVEISSSIMESLLGTSLIIFLVVFGTFSQGVIIPLVDTTRTVVYFELKSRKEGFDLEKRVEELTGPV